MSTSGSLGRVDWRTYVLGGQAVVLIALAVGGLATAGFHPFTGTPTDTVLGFRLNPMHSFLLLLTGLLALATSWPGHLRRRFLITQFVAYLLLFLYGAANVGEPRGTFLALNTPDMFLHAALSALSIAIWMTIALAATSTERD